MKEILNKLKLFLHSFLMKDVFMSKILKINILTCDILHSTRSIQKLGYIAGVTIGSSLTAYGIPPFIGIPLCASIGKFIGKQLDKELNEINNSFKTLNDKNQKSIQTDNKYLIIKLNKHINDLLDFLIFHVQKLSSEDKQLNDDEILTKLYLQMLKSKKKKNFSNAFIADLLSDDEVRNEILKLIKHCYQNKKEV